MRPTFSVLWAVNGPLELPELRRQLDDFAAAGLDGVVFHPRFYPDDPEYLGDDYLELVSTVILDARERGLAFWIYDENGWPSGSVGGRMLERFPELRQRWVELQPDTGQPAVRRFVDTGASWALVERAGDGVDYLSPMLADRFIELCYRRYADGLRADAVAHVEGFFSDEPEFGLGHSQHELARWGAVPWTSDLPERYAERCGRDLIADLPAIFVSEERSPLVRTVFWELVTDLFAERFLAKLDAWCRDRGLRFTAHMKGEEHPLFQLPTTGSLGVVSRAIGLPGVDALGREPGNDFYPRQASSATRQFGDGRAMAEAFGGAGWGAGPADLEAHLVWLGSHGITDFVLHLSQYRLDSAAIEDWPPSHPRHVSWSEVYPRVLDTVRRSLEVSPRPPADVLVVVPQRALAQRFEPWEFVSTNVHDARDFPPTAAGRINAGFMELVTRLRASGGRYEFADERTVEREARMVRGQLEIGRSRYARVIVATGAELDERTRDLLAPLVVAPPASPGPEHGVVTSAAAAPGVMSTAPLRWRLSRAPVNELVLEVHPDGGGRWSAEVPSRDYAGSVELRFADEPRDVRWDGGLLEVGPHGDAGYVAMAEVRPEHRALLSFSVPGEKRRDAVPRVWAAGRFLVRGTRVISQRAELCEVDGPFQLGRHSGGDLGRELIGAGFPFVFEPLAVEAEVDIPAGVGGLVLQGGLADAVLVQVGDEPAVWSWSRSEWRVPTRSVGVSTVRLRLVPNGFNRYGPHHHYAGDPRTVSPAQMRGERNYADDDGAPPVTHVSQWWLRRSVLPEAVGFVNEPGRGGSLGAIDNPAERALQYESVNRFTITKE